MSFAVPKRIIEEGDTVILFFNVVKMQPVEVVKQIVCRNGQLVRKFNFLKILRINDEYFAIIG